MKIYFKFKNFISILMVCLLLTSCVSVCAEGINLPQKTEGDTKFSITTPISDIKAGDSAYINISSENIPNGTYAYELWLKYDTDYLTYKSTNTNYKDDVEKIEKCESGVLKLAFTGLEVLAPEFSDCLAKIEFLAKKSGTTSVSLVYAIMVDSDMNFSEYTLDGVFADIIIKSKPSSGGSSGGSGGGGGGGGGVIISKPQNSDNDTNIVGTLSPTLEPKPVEENIEKNIVFSDLTDDNWASEAIYSLAELGIISGYPSGEFMPDNFVTRAEFIKILCLSLGVLTSPNIDESPFSDVQTNAWYAPYVYAAYKAEMINGYEDNSFRPENEINREEAATMLVKSLEKNNISISDDRLNKNFADENDISEYAIGYVDKLYTMSLINGDENNMFRPLDYLTRAEAMQMVWNVLLKINSSDNLDSSEKVLENFVEYAEELDSELNTPNPTDEPNNEPSDEPTQTPECTDVPLPTETPFWADNTDKADIRFECENINELYLSENVAVYEIPNDGSRDAFYDDFTTFQRIGDGEAYGVFMAPYAHRVVFTAYFYAGEELCDFEFFSSKDGEIWNSVDFNVNYHIEDGKWTKAEYELSLDSTKYVKAVFPDTINWWTPLISSVDVYTEDPKPMCIISDIKSSYLIPRYDVYSYTAYAYVADQIDEVYSENIVFSLSDNAPSGVTLLDNTLYVSPDAICDTEFFIICESIEYGLRDEKKVTLTAPLIGDINHDMKIDELDTKAVINLFSSNSDLENWISIREADINNDNVINVIDIAYIAKYAALSKTTDEVVQ